MFQFHCLNIPAVGCKFFMLLVEYFYVAFASIFDIIDCTLAVVYCKSVRLENILLCTFFCKN